MAFSRASVALLVLAIAGCSVLAPTDDELLGGGSAAAGGKSGAGGSGSTGGVSTGGASNTGGSSAGGTSAGGTSAGGTSAGGTSAGGTSAGGTSAGGSGGSGGCSPAVDATARPRATYLLLDRSTSMQGSNNQSATSAVNEFVLEASVAGMAFGIQYFPSNGGTCSGGGYSVPDVGFGALPGLASAIMTSLSGNNFVPATQLEGAFNGGKTAGTQYLTSKPPTQFDVVIVTDVTGSTSGGNCSTSSSVLAGILSSAWPAIATHLIGMPGADQTLITPFAAAGGTVGSVSVTSAASVKAALLRSVTSCRFAIPSTGTPTYTLVLGGAPVPLTKVTDHTQCGTGDAWFDYGGSAVLCPLSCQKLSAAASGKVQVASCP